MTCPTDSPLFPCPQCATPTVFRYGMGHFYPRRCPACTAEAKRAKDRRAAAKQRLKRGVAPVKGTVIACRSCGVQVTRNSLRNVRCRSCHKRRTLDRQYEAIKSRRQSEPGFALNLTISTSIRDSLKGRKGGRSWESLVGYSLDDLMRHLERQFLPGMTWENRGDWHIDHITALSTFRFETAEDPDFRAAWGLANLRPLWARENRIKSARRTHLL